MKPILRRTGWSMFAVATAIQLWPAGRTNPPVAADLVAPADVRAILRRSCYDCHSNETHWPWYARVAPVSWFLVHDVEKARAELNFSKWGEYSTHKQGSKRESLVDEIREGRMPPASYVRMHAGSAISPSDLEILSAWAGAPADPSPR